MKKLLLIVMILGFATSLFSQQHVIPNKEVRNFAVKKAHPSQHQKIGTKSPAIPSYKNGFPVDETIIGNTYYDLQTNTSSMSRLHMYPDGTMGGVWTFGLDFPNFTDDRGTGYNYYDGSAWGDWPTERIESLRTGWPSYAPYGENGELVVSHDFGAGTLYYFMRDEKGTGNWSEEEFLGPGGQQISWNRMTTGGINNSVIHTLCITWPIANSGTLYQGLDGAVLYSRSADGGTTWDPENVVLDGITANEYYGYSADMYDIVSHGENDVAILIGDSWRDLVLLKSTDGGDNWTKTVVWECPYPFFNLQTPTVTDTFYCPDGAHHLAFDNEDKVHVVFGINRAYSDGAGTFWFPGVGGIGYWNEDRPGFSNDLNALNPYGDPGTELEDDYSLIGWTQDINGNDTIDVLDDWGTYYLGFSSMPQILIDDMNQIFVVYSSVTEGYDNDAQSYRHLWSRYSPNGDFWGPFHHLTSELIHIFDECVFPSIASASDDSFYLLYQHDNEPGLAVRGDEDPFGENFISVMTVNKLEIWTGVKENNIPIYDYDVSQNYPNPFTTTSTVQVNLRHSAELSLDVVNMMGQKVYTINTGIAKPGMNTITIDGTKLTPGIYFYTVKAGESAITKKMIVD